MRGPLDAVRLRQLFDELSDELRWTRTRVQIYVVGGAAMSLAFARDRTTLDVDARIVSGHQRMIEVVQKIARKHGLDDSWLNEQATTAIPRKPDATAQVLYQSYGTSISDARRRPSPSTRSCSPTTTSSPRRRSS